jgi:hypothetical protein
MTLNLPNQFARIDPTLAGITERPGQAQKRVLKSILSAYNATEYGKKHGSSR